MSSFLKILGCFTVIGASLVENGLGQQQTGPWLSRTPVGAANGSGFRPPPPTFDGSSQAQGRPQNQAPPSAPRQVLQPQRPPLRAASSVRRTSFSQTSRQSALTPSRTFPLTLPRAFELTLTRNPAVVAQRAAEGVGVAAIGVARRYPFNPFFQFQATPYQKAPASATAVEPNAATKTYQYYLIMVNFELAHQRRYRERNAVAALSGVRWTIQQTELQNLAMTEQLYFTALYRRGLRDLAQANAELNDSLLSILERQLAAGQASAADVAMVRLDTRSTVQQQRLAETNYQTALLDLARQLNLSPRVPIDLVGQMYDWKWMPVSGAHLSRVVGLRGAISPDADMEAIASELASGRPDVMAARTNISAAGANVSLAQANRLPTLQAGPYYQSDDFGVKYFGFRGHVQAPALNGGWQLVRQRNAELRQQKIVYQQLRAQAAMEALTSIDRYERARRLVEETGAEAPFNVPVELKKLEEQFAAGEVDAFRIFNARTSLIRLQQANLDMLNEAAQAASQVTLSAGLPPDALLQAMDRRAAEGIAPPPLDIPPQIENPR